MIALAPEVARGLTTKRCYKCKSSKAIHFFTAREWAQRNPRCLQCCRNANKAHRGGKA